MATLSKERSRSLARLVRRHHPLLGAAPGGREALEAELSRELGSADCIEWGAGRTSHGYGNIGVKMCGSWKWFGAHKLIRETYDAVAAELDTLHKCSNKACIRWDHTYLGDDRQNALDRSVNGETPAIGDTHLSAKLSEERVLEARAVYASGGASYRALADRYGVTKSTMSKAIRGKTWARSL